MPEDPPDIYSILESFLSETFSSKYEGEEFDDLVKKAKQIIRERAERDMRRREAPSEDVGPRPRRPVFEREADIEEKLLESLKKSIEKEDDSA